MKESAPLVLLVPFAIQGTSWVVHLTVHDLGSEEEYVLLEGAKSGSRSQTPDEWEQTIEQEQCEGDFWREVFLQMKVLAFWGISSEVAQA